jgi:hypothetical protein
MSSSHGKIETCGLFIFVEDEEAYRMALGPPDQQTDVPVDHRQADGS